MNHNKEAKRLTFRRGSEVSQGTLKDCSPRVRLPNPRLGKQASGPGADAGHRRGFRVQGSARAGVGFRV